MEVLLFESPGAPGGSRTLNLRFRRPLLYPLSYGRTVSFYTRRVILSTISSREGTPGNHSLFVISMVIRWYIQLVS